MHDILVVGAGPAGLLIASALREAGLTVCVLAPNAPDTPWINTYASWVEDLQPPVYQQFLSHQWQDCSVIAEGRTIALARSYGLYDNLRFQAHLLQDLKTWQIGSAASVEHHATHSIVTTRDGQQIAARLVLDASGHKPALVQRPENPRMAYQAAYGILGTFSQPPVRANQAVVMDYSADHLTPAERQEPATFLYAMDLGQGRYFVEETSLAHTPGIPLKTLEYRLQKRLAARGIRVESTELIERCFFPMNPPLPARNQRVVGFGAAASMVHPPSGYMVSAAVRAAPRVASAIAQSLGVSNATPAAAARAGWQAIWPQEARARRNLYLFCLACLMRCNEAQTQQFFRTFFELPAPRSSGYFSGTLTTAQLMATMWQIFTQLPMPIRASFVRSMGYDGALLLGLQPARK